MVPESIAEHLISLILGLHIRPGEPVRVLQMELFPDPDPSGSFHPLAGESLADHADGPLISTAVAAVVPQPQNHDGPGPAGHVRELQAAPDVVYITFL